jgi:glycosyltransferase involved in cell wall biosynthesis
MVSMQYVTMEQPLVSVVLPTHNGARYLAESIESVLRQTHVNLELIIVDDASIDATPEIVALYAEQDGRVRTIRHEKNVKLPAALNSGFRIARGEYLTWTSDDNLYRPEAIAEMLDVLEHDSGVDLVYSDYSDIDDTGRVIRSIRVHPPEKLAHTNSVGVCFLYRRRVYEVLGDYNPAYLLVEDYEYWVRASAVFRLRPIHRDLYLRRLHESSLTARFHELVGEAHERVLRQHLPQMVWTGRAERATGYRLLADRAIARRDVRRALACLLHAGRLAPRDTVRWMMRRAREAIG